MVAEKQLKKLARSSRQQQEMIVASTQKQQRSLSRDSNLVMTSQSRDTISSVPLLRQKQMMLSRSRDNFTYQSRELVTSISRNSSREQFDKMSV